MCPSIVLGLRCAERENPAFVFGEADEPGADFRGGRRSALLSGTGSLFGRIAIRWKLILVSLLTTAIVLVAVAVAVFWYDSVSSRRRMVEDTTVLADMLEVSCAQAVVFADQESANEALATLKAQSQVEAAAVYAQEGRVFATYRRAGVSAWEPPPREPGGHRFESNHLALFHTMEFGPKEVGSVYLRVDMSALTARRHDYAKILAIDLVLAVLMALLLSSRLQALISRPILELVAIERTVSEKKDYSIRAVKRSSDEVGRLFDGFNEMLAEVEKRDAFLREKNEQILDSIRYAQTIQEAVLPRSEDLLAALPEYFVIFRPCHIVSGDFYWCHRGGGRVFLAVVDCTGHGVPGAFMSMVGGSLLRGIVVDRGVSDPTTILEQLHEGVRETLQQARRPEAQDGMDACLCVFDEASGEVRFAGAKRPLYLVRLAGGSDAELIEVPGNRSSIGGRQREGRRSFTTRVLHSAPGDMLYLTTDGFADQNAPSGKRFGSERFKSLLRAVAGEAPPAQMRRLLAEIEDHQAGEKQRDDITIVGVRVKPPAGRPDGS